MDMQDDPPKPIAALYSKSFPRKLYDLLTQTSPEIVGWLKEGVSFRVEDEAVFCSQVLPRYFSHTKMTSFKRQLNIYGFRCFTKGAEAGAYFHPCFVRGQPELLDCIQVRRSPRPKAVGSVARAVPPCPVRVSTLAAVLVALARHTPNSTPMPPGR
jgi:hypothetical protein